ncbi:hypothetical protein TWF703_005746 [Orbilia oligospora]|uniref:DUF866 domain protein n=1 Tax=Orbilia oligospora TaxID=2813651 RepID=A0A7C8JZV4_ORBOL|nr:hypothetical protein TWF703_005746 [Orbilia oligospora]
MFLALIAELAGVTNLRPNDSEDSPYYYTFKVQCTSCRETHPNWVGVSKYDTNEISGSRGEANFVWKCKNCKREHSANIKTKATPYEQSEPAKRQNIIELECRGLEFVEFKPDGEWLCEGLESGTKFTGVELSDGEWFDYDEKAGEEVSIQRLTVDLMSRSVGRPMNKYMKPILKAELHNGDQGPHYHKPYPTFDKA